MAQQMLSTPSPMDHPTLHLPSYLQPAATTAASNLKRVLLIGLSGHGKSYSVGMTAPNPIFAEFDKNLPPEIRSRSDAHFIPFYDEAFAKKHFLVMNTPDALSKFIGTDGMKLTADQTLIIDHLSALYDAFRLSREPMIPGAAQGKPDAYWYWKQLTAYFVDLMTMLRRLSCNVVLIAHEHELRETDTGKLQGYRWWLPGQEFSPRLPSFFTDVFRQVRKPSSAGDKVVNTYIWQIQGNAMFPSGKTTIRSTRLEVPASWQSFAIKD